MLFIFGASFEVEVNYKSLFIRLGTRKRPYFERFYNALGYPSH
jgi:hypothetical protein